jgi:hypothetical protein
MWSLNVTVTIKESDNGLHRFAGSSTTALDRFWETMFNRGTRPVYYQGYSSTVVGENRYEITFKLDYEVASLNLTQCISLRCRWGRGGLYPATSLSSKGRFRRAYEFIKNFAATTHVPLGLQVIILLVLNCKYCLVAVIYTNRCRTP